jgi:hypothetical protein
LGSSGGGIDDMPFVALHLRPECRRGKGRQHRRAGRDALAAVAGTGGLGRDESAKVSFA